MSPKSFRGKPFCVPATVARRIWFRWIDRELRRTVVLPEVVSGEQGKWNAWVGQTGERLAGKRLSSEGYRVLYRNFRPTGGGEVDLVCRHVDTLVFVEVKTRTSERFGRPSQAVDRQKQRLLVRGANAWLRELGLPELLFRFDVVEVILENGRRPEIRIIESAFQTRQVGLGL